MGLLVRLETARRGPFGVPLSAAVMQLLRVSLDGAPCDRRRCSYKTRVGCPDARPHVGGVIVVSTCPSITGEVQHPLVPITLAQ